MNPEELKIREILEEIRVKDIPLEQGVIDEIVVSLQSGLKSKQITQDIKERVVEQETLEIMRSTHPDWRERARAAARIISLNLE